MTGTGRIRLARVAGQLVDRLVPAQCWLCAGATAAAHALCRRCWRLLPWLEGAACERCALPLPVTGICGRCIGSTPLVNRAWAALRYEGLARDLVHRFKFGGDLVAGRVLSDALMWRVSNHCRRIPLVPIPSTRERCARRGFDPALEIARRVAVQRGLELSATLLRRRWDTPAQSSLSARSERVANADAMFHVKHHMSVPNRVLLVDDVMTTGATAHAAARALLEFGVCEIELWLCARTP